MNYAVPATFAPSTIVPVDYSNNALTLRSSHQDEEQRHPMKIRRNALSALHADETGQGLVEYLLILALVAFAATAGMQSLAKKLDSAFDQVAALVGSYIT